MKLFITGASGFIGGALCRELNQTHELLAMARSRRSAEKVRSAGAVPVKTALGEVSISDLDGVDVVVHCAARVESHGSWKQFHEANVAGTLQLLEVARKTGVSRFVHLGTEAAMFRGQDMVDIDETEPYALDSPYFYSRSKAMAEQAVLAANNPETGFQTISIRPCKVWGAGDQTIISEVADLHHKGAFTWIDGGENLTSTTHIDNLVRGLILAIESERDGEAYFIIDDEKHTIKEFLTRYLATQGIVLSERSLPSAPLRLAASVVERIWHRLRPGSKPPLSAMAVAMMGATCTINGSKARHQLGYAPVTNFNTGLSAMPDVGP